MVLYYALLVLDKTFTYASAEQVKNTTQLILANSDLKTALGELLGYNGISVKMCVLRIYGHLFTNAKEKHFSEGTELANKMLRVLTYPFITEDMAEQALKNCVFLCKL